MKYTDMKAGDMLQALADDGMKWATAFREKYPDVPEDAAFGWFANAIENTWDTRCSRATHDDAALLDHVSDLVRNRDFWRELASAEGSPEAATTVQQIRDEVK